MNEQLVCIYRFRQRRTYLFSVIGFLAFLPMASFGAGKKSPQPKTSTTKTDDNFALADADHNGKLSRGELGDYLVYEVFSLADTNRDGRISLQEWLRVKPGETAAFKERDANSDGYVTLPEGIEYGRRGASGRARGFRRANAATPSAWGHPGTLVLTCGP